VQPDIHLVHQNSISEVPYALDGAQYASGLEIHNSARSNQLCPV